jgi:hypothetical protein
MIIIFIILGLAALGALGFYGYRYYNEMLARRMDENEYNTAVMLWEFAKRIKSEIEKAMRPGKGVLDFTNITIPSSAGYRVSLELAGASFRVYAVPLRYTRTGRLSFITDTTLVVRAADHQGESASIEDEEYTRVSG